MESNTSRKRGVARGFMQEKVKTKWKRQRKIITSLVNLVMVKPFRQQMAFLSENRTVKINSTECK